MAHCVQAHLSAHTCSEANNRNTESCCRKKIVRAFPVITGLTGLVVMTPC